jgi:hypothetical protein
MTKASRIQRNVADKQLAGIDIVEAKRKWREGLPVTLKEMSVALELGYSTVRQYGKMRGFPMLKGCVFPRIFDSWLKECFRSQSSGASAIPEGSMATEMTRGVRSALGNNSATRLPIQAQRLLEVAGIRK